ncbi:unnamed protein product [Rangifer tarandus platyrhynchus]|uniref:Uncharacterized protein n=1 Tax=Rangifer tarandus platyrhynchus TaxID=3082113 RepID=A0ABN8ZIA4_RANTA|nr:unnamed protein product [Rangifer tarandus platyrhynchus]
MEPPPTRRRLAPGDGFVRRPEPRRQAPPPPPPAGRPRALASQNRVPVWPGPSACLHPKPRDWGVGVIRLLCCHRRCRNRLRAPVAPALRLPGARAVGAARGHRPREAAAVCAYLSPVLLRRGGGAVWRRHRWAALAVLPAAAAASVSRCCCCCRRGRCLRRGGGGAFPVRLR